MEYVIFGNAELLRKYSDWIYYVSSLKRKQQSLCFNLALLLTLLPVILLNVRCLSWHVFQYLLSGALFLNMTTKYFPTCFFLLQSLKKVGQDSIVLLICITVFLSYLPEAGQYSSFFLYLRQVNEHFDTDLNGSKFTSRLQCCWVNTKSIGIKYNLKACSS